jgi:dolichol kinase
MPQRAARGGQARHTWAGAGRRVAGRGIWKGGRRVTIGGSFALIVIGAILRFGVTWKPAHVDLQAIGVILMIAGVVALIISIVFLATRRRGRATAEVYEERRYTEPPA